MQFSTSPDAFTAPLSDSPALQALGTVPTQSVQQTGREGVSGGSWASRGEPSEVGSREAPETLPDPRSFLIHRQKEAGVEEQRSYGEITSENVETGLTRRVNRYGRARKRSLAVADWLLEQVGGEVVSGSDPDGKRAALSRLLDCGSYLEFRQYHSLPGLPVRLHAASFCKQPKLCAFCAIRRSTKLLRAYLPKVLTAVSQGLRVYFVTFTAVNGEGLADRYQLIDGTLRRLMKDAWRARRGDLRGHAWAGIKGAVFSYEFKRGSGSGLWHPHAHGLIFVEGDLWDVQAQEIIDAWCIGTGESVPQAQDIRPLYSLPGDVGAEPDSESQIAAAVGSDLVEVFKYPLKFSNMDPADTWHAAGAMARRHLIRPFGLMRGVKISEKYADEPLNYNDLPYLRLLLRFDPMAAAYVTRERVFIDSKVMND